MFFTCFYRSLLRLSFARSLHLYRIGGSLTNSWEPSVNHIAFRSLCDVSHENVVEMAQLHRNWFAVNDLVRIGNGQLNRIAMYSITFLQENDEWLARFLLNRLVFVLRFFFYCKQSSQIQRLFLLSNSRFSFLLFIICVHRFFGDLFRSCVSHSSAEACFRTTRKPASS